MAIGGRSRGSSGCSTAAWAPSRPARRARLRRRRRRTRSRRLHLRPDDHAAPDPARHPRHGDGQRPAHGHRHRAHRAGLAGAGVVRHAGRVGAADVHLLDLRPAARRRVVVRRPDLRGAGARAALRGPLGVRPVRRCARRPTRPRSARSSRRWRPRTSTPAATPSGCRGPRCSIGAPFGMREDRVASLRYAGMLHDVGKLGVPTAVLQKAGRLTDDRVRGDPAAPRARSRDHQATSSSSARRSRASTCTTSASTAAATRWGSRARRSPSSPASSPWPTPSTP